MFIWTISDPERKEKAEYEPFGPFSPFSSKRSLHSSLRYRFCNVFVFVFFFFLRSSTGHDRSSRDSSLLGYRVPQRSLLASQTVVNLKALCKCLDPTGTLSGLKTKTEWANRVLQLLDALDTPPLFYEEKYHYFYSGHVAENEEYVANINKMQDHYTACVLKTEEINKALEDIAEVVA